MTAAGRFSFDREHGMASKKTLNAKNLEALGAARMAELLLELSAGDAAAKRRLRLELAGSESAGEVAREVRKRLASIARARSFIDWQKRKAFVDDLETQRRAIVEKVAPSDPAEAFELMWRFLALASPVFGRCDDSSGTVGDVFRMACHDLGDLAAAAKPQPEDLAERVYAALTENDYGQYDALIPVLAPALGPEGLERLKARFVELSAQPVERPPEGERRVIGWSSRGPIHADEIAETARQSTVRMALKDIADLQGDVDGFIAQYDENTRKVPKIAAEIARRLLAAGRAEEAWEAINAVGEDRRGWIPHEWEETRLAVMEALGRHEEAQAFRWTCFKRGLDASHLRAYLKRLPDFDDLEAERKALAHATAYPGVHEALIFLVSWPALDEAARLVLDRAAELDGDHYEILAPAADALEVKHPLAATVLRRAMIDFTLTASRAKRYRHAARHLAECAGLVAMIPDYGAFAPHDAYVARLRAEHGRKSAFWSLLS